MLTKLPVAYGTKSHYSNNLYLLILPTNCLYTSYFHKTEYKREWMKNEQKISDSKFKSELKSYNLKMKKKKTAENTTNQFNIE